MPVRRVASSGFGGASPGLRILQGQAAGELKRQETEREEQRQAILQRLTEQRTESLAQDSRLQAEKAQHDKDVFARKLVTDEATAEAYRASLIQQHPGIDPKTLNDVALPGLEAIGQTYIDAQKIAASKQAVSASQTSQQGDILDNERLIQEAAAKELVANNDFYHIASFDGAQLATPEGADLPEGMELESKPGISEPSRLAALKAAFPDTEPAVLMIALAQVRADEEKIKNMKAGRIQPGLDPRTAGARPTPDRVRTSANDAENRGLAAGLTAEEVIAGIQENNIDGQKADANRAFYEAIVKELKRRSGLTGGSGISGVR